MYLHNSNFLRNKKNIFIIAICLILFPLLGRWLINDRDFSFFIVASSVYVDSGNIQDSIYINVNSGYDGQFYYKLALNPFDFSKQSDGIKFDNPVYRTQRILYPLFCWMFSFGNTSLIPIVMVLINSLAIFLIWYIFLLFCKMFNQNIAYSLIPILFSGLYISLGRDLLEPLESLFVILVFYFLFRKKYVLASLFMLFAFFTKETSILFIIPVMLFECYSFLFSNQNYSKKKLIRIILFSIPFILFIFWRVFLNHQYNIENIFIGSLNFTFPFYGIYQGLLDNLPLHGFFDLSALIMIILHLIWSNVLICYSLKYIYKMIKSNNCTLVILALSWLFWFIVSILFSENIFVDFYGFVRIFCSFNLISFLILIIYHHRLRRVFIFYTIALYMTTVVRLWLYA